MLLPGTHKPALHTGSSAPGSAVLLIQTPNRVYMDGAREKGGLEGFSIFCFTDQEGNSLSPFIFLSSAVHVLEPAWLCYLSLAFAYSHQGEIKPGKMQKGCRTVGATEDPSGLIQEYNRAHCTVQLRNKFFLKWGHQFYCHYSAVVSAFISSPYSKAFSSGQY